MNFRLTPEQEKIIENEIKAGRFHSVEEVIGEALRALREKDAATGLANGSQREAVRTMLEFVNTNSVRLEGVSVRQLVHEGHRL